VADYRPSQVSEQKIKRSGADLTLTLVPNPDIVKTIAESAERPKVVVAFAAETEHLEAHARGKLERKRVDAVAANRVDAGLAFDCEDNALTLIDAAGQVELTRAPKRQLAQALLETLIARFPVLEGGSDA
jgi:phosphopantothenoylcysteine decarboxylase/phosphopantothenate--cysteine ligase